MVKKPKKKEDIEKIKRVHDVFLAHSLNLNELTCQKDLTLFKTKLNLIKSEKPRISFKKSTREKYVMIYLDLDIEDDLTLSKAMILNKDASQFETEIQDQGYRIKPNTGLTLKVYELNE